jgi:hypothetical protein
MTKQKDAPVVAGMVRKLDLTPDEQLQAVASWLLTDVHLGPHTPGRDSIVLAATELYRIARSQEQPKPDSVLSSAEGTTAITHRLDEVIGLLKDIAMGLA